jgi:RNA polymerase sigma factor (sigma-70 family)
MTHLFGRLAGFTSWINKHCPLELNMPKHRVGLVVHCLNRLADHNGTAHLSDRQLLDCYVQQQDDAAFAALVQRHGGLVWGVCKRVLPNRADAEDVFQAAFLVLVQKAPSLTRIRSLGSWLYKVTYHIALRCRARIATRCQYEPLCPSPVAEPDAGAIVADRELEQLIDAALQELPAKHRTPLILCYLEGKTNAEAARQLGWPLGTMSGRLAQARELLRRRLARRGVTLSVAGLSLLAARSQVPPALAEQTVKAAGLLTIGEAAGRAALSGEVASLLQGTLHAMMLKKLRLLALVLLAVGLLSSAAGIGLYSSAGAQPPAAEQAPAAKSAEPSAAAAPPARTDRYDDPLPADALARLGTVRLRHPGIFFAACLPDASGVVTASSDGGLRLWDLQSGKEIRRYLKPAEKADIAGVKNLLKEAFQQAGLDGDSMMNMFSEMGFGGRLPGEATVVLAPDGLTLASASLGGRITLWEVKTGKVLRQIKPEQETFGSVLLFSPDSKFLASQSGRQVVLYDPATGKEIRRWEPKADGKKNPLELVASSSLGGSLAFAPDGKQLVCWEITFDDNKPGAVGKVYEVETGKTLRTFKGPRLEFGASVLSPDSKVLASVKLGGEIILWDTTADKELHLLKRGGGVNGLGGLPTLSFSRDSKHLALRAGADGTIEVWEVASGKLAGTVGENRPRPLDEDNVKIQISGAMAGNLIVFGPDGKTLLAGGDNNTIRIWDWTTGSERAIAGGHQGTVLALVPSADGKTVTTQGQDNWVRAWDAATGKEIDSFRLPAGASAATFSADSKYVAFTVADKTVRLADVRTGKEVRTCDGKSSVSELAFSADGTILAGTSDYRTVQLWETATGKRLRELAASNEQAEAGGAGVISVPVPTGPPGAGRGLQVSPDGRIVAALAASKGKFMVNGGQATLARDNNVIRLWDTASGKTLRRLESGKTGMLAFAFAPDGRTLAVATADGTLSVWETATGAIRRQLKGGAAGPATGLAFAPDGRTLAVASRDRGIRFWDLATGTDIGELRGHQGRVTSLAFAAQGRTLFSGSADTTGLVWDLGKLRQPPAPEAVALDDRQTEVLWTDLAGSEAAKADQAIRSLVQCKQAAALLDKHLKPIAAPEPQKLNELLAALLSERFGDRQKAETELTKLGELALPPLDKALASTTGLEKRQRLEQMRDRLVTGNLPAETLQAVRAVEVLEQIGSKEARAILAKLVGGAPEARVTREASAALTRLNRP